MCPLAVAILRIYSIWRFLLFICYLFLQGVADKGKVPAQDPAAREAEVRSILKELNAEAGLNEKVRRI